MRHVTIDMTLLWHQDPYGYIPRKKINVTVDRGSYIDMMAYIVGNNNFSERKWIP